MTPQGISWLALAGRCEPSSTSTFLAKNLSIQNYHQTQWPHCEFHHANSLEVCKKVTTQHKQMKQEGQARASTCNQVFFGRKKPFHTGQIDPQLQICIVIRLNHQLQAQMFQKRFVSFCARTLTYHWYRHLFWHWYKRPQNALWILQVWTEPWQHLVY